MGHSEIPAPRFRQEILNMRKILLQIGLAIPILLGVFLLSNNKAQAEILYQQPVGGDTRSVVGSPGNTTSLTVSTAFTPSTNVTSNTDIQIFVQEIVIAGNFSPCGGVDISDDPSATSSSAQIQWDLEDGTYNGLLGIPDTFTTLFAETPYYVKIRYGNCTGTNTIDTNFNGNFQGYVITGSTTPPSQFFSFWIPPYTPATGSLAASTSVAFEANYSFDCTASYGLLDTVAFEITDTGTNNGPTRFGETPISSCGESTLQATTTLIQGHFYLWRPVLFSSEETSSPIFGDLYSLDVVSRAGSSTPFLSGTVGTSTLPDSTNLLSFLNVPQLLATKIPFAYIFQIADGIKTGISSSTAATIPSGTFTWKGPTGATTTTDFFSTTTIGYYFSPSLISAWRAFELAILYITFGYALYMRAKHKDII